MDGWSIGRHGYHEYDKMGKKYKKQRILTYTCEGSWNVERVEGLLWEWKVIFREVMEVIDRLAKWRGHIVGSVWNMIKYGFKLNLARNYHTEGKVWSIFRCTANVS